MKCSDRWWIAEHDSQLRRLSRRCGSCQRKELRQVLLQTEVFNRSQARARGEVSTGGTETGTMHLISIPGALWCSVLCVRLQ